MAHHSDLPYLILRLQSINALGYIAVSFTVILERTPLREVFNRCLNYGKVVPLPLESPPGHDPFQNFIRICQVVTIYKI